MYPEEMPEGYCFSGTIAFCWGFIIEDPQECGVYQSKQFQIGDSVNKEKGSKRQEANSIERDCKCGL
jgi:hypothetical protein